MNDTSLDSRFERFLRMHTGMLRTRRGAEYRELSRLYFFSYRPEAFEEEMHIADMVFARIMIRSWADLEAVYAEKGDARSFQDWRKRYHRRYTKARKVLEKLLRARGASVPAGAMMP